MSGSGPDCKANIQSDGYNLLGDSTGCNFIPAIGDLLGIDAMLYLPFGIPRTITMLPDSPLIDGGNPLECLDHLDNPISHDQLGTDRPIDGDGDSIAICDIGAFEYNPHFPPRWSFLTATYK